MAYRDTGRYMGQGQILKWLGLSQLYKWESRGESCMRSLCNKWVTTFWRRLIAKKDWPRYATGWCRATWVGISSTIILRKISGSVNVCPSWCWSWFAGMLTDIANISAPDSIPAVCIGPNIQSKATWKTAKPAIWEGGIRNTVDALY